MTASQGVGGPDALVLRPEDHFSSRPTGVRLVFTMAWGEEFLQMADVLALSVRQNHPDLPLIAFVPSQEQGNLQNFDEVRPFDWRELVPGSVDVWHELPESAKRMASRYRLAGGLGERTMYVDADCLQLRPIGEEDLASIDWSVPFIGYEDWSQETWETRLKNSKAERDACAYFSDGIFIVGSDFGRFLRRLDDGVTSRADLLHCHMHALSIANLVCRSSPRKMAALLPKGFVRCARGWRYPRPVFFHATPRKAPFWRMASKLGLA